MLSNVKKLDLPVDIQLGLYNQLVVPVVLLLLQLVVPSSLLYGCEVWGYHNLTEIELCQRRFFEEHS